MATHKVTMELPPRTITKADAVFKVRQDGDLLGTLTVSRGSLVWFPPGTTYGHKIGWKKFARLMEEQAPRFETR
jgi:hypothetical protein